MISVSRWVLLATPLCWGCSALTLMHTARPIERGTFGVGVDGVGFVAFVPEYQALRPAPTGEFLLRYGIAENADVGLKYTFPSSLAVDFNYLVWAGSGIALSVDPILAATETGLFLPWAMVALVGDMVTTEKTTLSVNMRGGVGRVSVCAGSGVGLKYQLVGWLKVFPELSILASWPFYRRQVLLNYVLALGFIY